MLQFIVDKLVAANLEVRNNKVIRLLREPPKYPFGDEWTVETLETDKVGKPNDPHGPVAVYPDFADPVEYQGRSYPRHLRTTWTRRDGLEINMQVRTDPADGPVILGFAVITKNGLREDYRRLPIPSMANHAAKTHGFAGSVPNVRPAKPLMDEEDKMRRLRLVADAYKKGLNRGEKVISQELLEHGKKLTIARYIKIVLDENLMSVSESRISHLISEARRTKDPLTGKTFLPPTDPGKRKA